MIANTIGELKHRIVVCTLVYVIFGVTDFETPNTHGKRATWPCKVPCFLGPIVAPLGGIHNTIGKAKPHVAKATCFVGPFATRAGGGARGASRRRRGSPGVARRLLGGSILIRVVKCVVSEARVRQSVVNMHISQGAPRGAPGDLTRECPWEADTPHLAFWTA